MVSCMPRSPDFSANFGLLEKEGRRGRKDFGTMVFTAPLSGMVQPKIKRRSYDYHEPGILTVAAPCGKTRYWPHRVTILSAW